MFTIQTIIGPVLYKLLCNFANNINNKYIVYRQTRLYHLIIIYHLSKVSFKFSSGSQLDLNVG